MWREFIRSYTLHCEFEEPASIDEIAEVERGLGNALSHELRGLLQETNGASVGVEFPGVEDRSYFSLVWSTQEMIEENLRLRTLDRDEGDKVDSLADLLFFSTAPNGDPMAMPVIEGYAQDGPIIVVSQEDHSEQREQFATLREHLTSFLEWASEFEQDTC